MTAPAERIWVLREYGAMIDCGYTAINTMTNWRGENADLQRLWEDMGTVKDLYSHGPYTLTLEAHPRPSEVQS